jgi:hypothetical protein
MNFNELPVFSNEFKRLAKKYKSLPEDLEEFKRVVAVVPLGTSKHFNIVTRSERCIIVKARFFCRYLKGSSLRIIYGYKEDSAFIEFIEIYFKGDKENENQDRIVEYLKSD